MADAVLYTEPVSYPTISAVSNGKLEVKKQDIARMRLPNTLFNVVGKRASTSDAWQIDIIQQESRLVEFDFALAEASINPDTLGWKSMADLALKEHSHPASSARWPLIEVHKVGERGIALSDFGFVMADASMPTGYKQATVAQASEVIWAEVDEAGSIIVKYNGTDSSKARITARSLMVNQIASAVAYILGRTSSTSETIFLSGYADLYGYAVGEMVNEVNLIQASGTESIEVGNYGVGKREVLVETAVPGMNAGFYDRILGANASLAVPSIVMDALRKSAKAGNRARISIIATSEGDRPALTIRNMLASIGANASNSATVMAICACDPNGVVEMCFDQANSLNVLATAAFAGLGGLVATGTATELERILANSPLSPVFANVATMLGATTASVLTGYVGALVAAYTQGWISNDQLFNLSNHVAWLKGGLGAITAAAAAGVAIGEIPTLLQYLGVSNNVLSIAMTAVGGAATSAGVALGMASVMAKCVRHMYWGA